MFIWRLGAVARSVACPLGMQAAPFDPHGRHFLSWRLGHEKNSPSSADSRRAVVSYWRKNVH